MESSLGAFELRTPRDRNGSFDTQNVGKRQFSISSDIDKKTLGLYGLGMCYSDIQSHLRELYDFEISDGTISSITDRIIREIKDWQNRPLESVYPVLWLDAMHYKVREDGQVKSKAVYSVLSFAMEGTKEVLGIYFGSSESSSFWPQVLNNLKEKGVEYVFIACIDNLNGFADAIDDYFPKTEVQLCLSYKYCNYKDLREGMRDLKLVYKALTKQLGLEELEATQEKWGKKYPAIFKNWNKHLN
jgi:putative transposase